MAKISVIGGVSDVNAPAPVIVGESAPEPIQVEDILAGAVVVLPRQHGPKVTARRRTSDPKDAA